MIDSYKRLFSKRKITINLLMLDIIERLHHKLPHEAHYGLTELYEEISHPKPTFSNYRAQLLTLETAKCILIKTSKEKASKKSVHLAEDFRKELERDVYA
jgi:hypothetical protein